MITPSGIKEIAKARDFTDTTGSGADGFSMVWDDAAGKFVLSEITGVSDHGALTGLADDDHTQYHNDFRGDARYRLLSTAIDHGALTGLGDDDHTQYHTDARGDIRYGQLADDNVWVEKNQFDKNPTADWYDHPLYDATNGEEFNDAFTGWTVETAASGVATNVQPGFLYLAANASTSFAYSRPSGINIESLPDSSNSDCYFGPIFLRQITYTDDIDIEFALHKDSSGSPDLNNFVATQIKYDSTDGKWKARGTRKDPSGFQAYGPYIEFSEYPFEQGFWIRNVIQKGGAVKSMLSNQKVYLSYYQMYGSFLTTTIWGDYHVRISLTRGAGPQFYMMIGGVDFSNRG